MLLAVILDIAFQDPLDSSVYTLQNFRDLYLYPFVYGALYNTAVFTAVTVFVALFFAVPIAWLAERTDLPGRSLVFPMMTASAVIPGTFGALGWLFMFHPRIGTINHWLMDLLPFIDSPPINIVSVSAWDSFRASGFHRWRSSCWRPRSGPWIPPWRRARRSTA